MFLSHRTELTCNLTFAWNSTTFDLQTILLSKKWLNIWTDNKGDEISIGRPLLKTAAVLMLPQLWNFIICAIYFSLPYIKCDIISTSWAATSAYFDCDSSGVYSFSMAAFCIDKQSIKL